jgi:hypothetical protein
VKSQKKNRRGSFSRIDPDFFIRVWPKQLETWDAQAGNYSPDANIGDSVSDADNNDSFDYGSSYIDNSFNLSRRNLLCL